MLVGVLLVVWGCGVTDKDNASNDLPATAESDRGDQAASQVLEGHYVFGHEVNVFEPCRTTRAYWIVGDSATTDGVRRTYLKWADSVGSAPYSPMFAQFRGRITREEGDGFAADTDGLFHVEEVLSLRAVQEGDCGPLPKP